MVTDEKVQRGVWEIDLGRGKKVSVWVLIVLVAVSLSLVYTAGQFRGLEKREAIELAQLARNLARGEGFTTYVIRPLSLWHLKTHGPDKNPRLVNHPDLVNPPLYPLVLAGLFRLLPPAALEFKAGDRVYLPERWVILPFNQVCLLLSVLLAYGWAKQLFDRRVAITAAWLLFLSDQLWSFSVSGLPTNFLMLLVLIAFWLLQRTDQQLNPVASGHAAAAAAQPALTGWPVLALLGSAVVLGLCFLTSYRAGVLLLPAALYLRSLMRGRRPWAWVTLYVVVFAVVVAPWLVRNYAVSHSLLGIARYEILQGTGTWSGDTLARSYAPELEFSLRSLAGKFLTGTKQHLLTTFKNTQSDFLIFFFAVGVLYGFRRRDVFRLRGVVLGSLLVGVVTMALLGYHEPGGSGPIDGGHLLVLFLPLVAVYGTAFFYLLLDRIQFRFRLTRGLAIGAFVFVNVLPMIYTLLPPRRGAFPYPPYFPPYTRIVGSMFTKNDIGCSDLPWAMAWYGDRRTIWLPLAVESLYEFHDVLTPPGYSLSFVMITPYMLNQRFQADILKGEYKPWSMLIRGQIPQLFPLKAMTLIPPDSDQVLLADRPRWQKGEFTTTEPPAPAPAAPAAAPAPRP